MFIFCSNARQAKLGKDGVSCSSKTKKIGMHQGMSRLQSFLSQGNAEGHYDDDDDSPVAL